jgi:branched-chain amino acid transport system permease protein
VNLAGLTLVVGLSTGMVYALVATGMLLVYNATSAVNLAHGDLITLGMYIAVVALLHAHISWWLTVPAGIVLGALAGLVMELIAYRPFIGRAEGGGHGVLLLVFITTLALSQAVEGGLSEVTTTEGTGAPPVFAAVSYHLGPFAATPQEIVTFLVAGACVALIALGLRYLQVGRVMRAISQHADAASLLGVNPRRVAALAWALSGAAAGVAGALFAPGSIVTPFSGSTYLFVAFAAAVVGGFGSIGGAVAGAMILGISEAFFQTYVSVVWSAIVPFAVLIIVVAVRPSGIFGIRVQRV